jgi:hypothetical protein
MHLDIVIQSINIIGWDLKLRSSGNVDYCGGSDGSAEMTMEFDFRNGIIFGIKTFHGCSLLVVIDGLFATSVASMLQ